MPCASSNLTCVLTESVVPKRSPGEGEPWLDPKYLPPEVPPNDTAGVQRAAPNPYATITPGVTTQGIVANAGLGRGGKFQKDKGLLAGRLKPAALASSYFPKS